MNVKIQLVVLIVCLAAWQSAAQDEPVEKQAIIVKPDERRPDPNIAHIRRILEENSKALQSLDNKAHGISNAQKGIESKLRVLGQDVAGIGRLENGLKKLDLVTASNFQLTANGIKNLTASIRAAENNTNKAIASLARGQLDIKVVLTKVDVNQNKHERKLDEVAKSVHQHIAGLDNLLKQSVLKELVTLVQTAKKLEQSQRHIESKVNRLDELAALSAITANKVQHLELGLHSINSTQHRQLAAIAHGVQQVGASSWQIDNKLGVLLSTQKNIERAVHECKKCQPPQHRDIHKHPDHRDLYKQPEHQKEHWEHSGYGYEEKNAPKPVAKTEYESSYANADEASYLYQLWYGKDDK